MDPDDLELVARLERGLEGLDAARAEWTRTSQRAQRVINRIIVLRGQRRLLTVRMQYVARLRDAGIASLEAELAELEGGIEAQAKERMKMSEGRGKKGVEKIPQVKARDEAGKAAGVSASGQHLMRAR